MKKYIPIFILFALFDIILNECNLENPILLKNGTCVSHYCGQKDFISNDCIIDNSIIKIQWLNNIIRVGGDTFRYLNFVKFSNGDLVFETTPYSYNDPKRNFYGLKKNGRYYFRDKENNKMTSFFSLDNGQKTKYESINAIISNNGKEYFMSIGRLMTHTEIFDFEDGKIYGAKTIDFISYNNSNIVDTLVYLNSTENCFIYPIIIKDENLLYRTVIIKLNITLSESKNLSSTIINRVEKNDTFGDMAFCFKTESTIIICFYGYSNTSTSAYYNIVAFNEDLEELCEEIIAYPENRRTNTFFSAIHFKGESGIFFNYKYLNDSYTLYPYIFFKKYNIKTSKFENVFSANNSIILKEFIFINNWGMNDLLKISESKIGFFSSSKDKKILYIVLISIFDEDKIKTRYYKIKTFDLYNITFFQEINTIIYNKFIVFGFNQYTTKNYDSSLIIFSYPNGTDSNIDAINYLFNNNDISIKNLYFNLSENLTIENNLFGYIYYGIIVQNISIIGDINLVSFLSNKKVEIDNALDKADMLKINFVNNKFEFELNIQYAYIAIESEFEENEKFPIIITTENEKEDEAQFNKNREKYTGRALFFNFFINQELNLSCDNIGCELCLESDRNYCITCKYNFTYDINGNKICDKYEYSNEDILNNNCKEKEITVEQAKEIYEILKNNLTKEYSNKTTIKTSNFIFQLISLEEQKDNIKENISYIDFGECENILKKKTSNLLVMLKTDIKENKYSSTYVQYEIYDSLTGNKINLTECQDMNIDIYIPTTLDNNSLYLFNDLKDNGYNIFDINDSFYNNICGTYTTINGKDILLSDRIEDIYNPTIEKYHCQENCDIKSYIDEYKKILCECPLEEEEIKIDVEEQNFHQKFLSSFTNTWKSSNFLVVKCFIYFLNFITIINNKGCIIMSTIIIIFIIFMLIYCFKGQQQLNELIKKILKIIKIKKEKSNVKIDNIKNNTIRNSEIKKLSHRSLLSNNSSLKVSIKSKKNKSKNIKTDITKNGPPKNDKKESAKKTNNESHSTKKTIKIRGKIKHNTHITKKNDIFIFPKIINNKSEIMMNDYELNTLEYEEAKKVDKRTFVEYYFSLLKLKNLILFTFFYNQDYNLMSIKISLFLLIFSLHFTVNSFFFNDDTMHKIYKDNSSYNFIFQIPIILYSTIISSTINIILKFLSLSEKNILLIKKEKNYIDSVNESINVKKCLRKKLIIYFILGIILLLFFWYFISCFCFVFYNTQIILIKDSFISFSLSIVYPFLLNIFPGLLRIYSLNKNKKSLYRFSVVLLSLL